MTVKNKAKFTSFQTDNPYLSPVFSTGAKEVSLGESAVVLPTYRDDNELSLLKENADFLLNNDNDSKNILKESMVGYLYNVYYKSLVLDESAKQVHAANIKNYLTEELDKLGGTDVLLSEFKNSNSELLNLLAEGCKKRAKKKLSEEDEENADEDTDNSDVESELDIPEDYNSDKVSEIIKDKVIQVIQDEEEETKRQEELIDDIKASKAVNESVNIIKNNPVEEFSLFKSLSIATSKQALKESSTGIIHHGNKDGNDIKLNMEYILAESIMKYTLLEMFNTLRIKDYDFKEIQSLTESLVYSK